jgi:2,3-diketo-5-methylthio-1-phosphopentane phosphatase
MRSTILFFDFDNTLTAGDVLDGIIEKFSFDERWREWERAWIEGRLSARDCLRSQVENLRVTESELLAHLSSVRIDPAFAEILAWARPRGVGVEIVSDSFLPLILHILRCNGIGGVPVWANDLVFSRGRIIPRFPYFDPAFPRSANAKARHLARFREHTVVFAGDGRSDLDAALQADIVFAKDALAIELGLRSVPFRSFTSLAPVLAFLETSVGHDAGIAVR